MVRRTNKRIKSEWTTRYEEMKKNQKLRTVLMILTNSVSFLQIQQRRSKRRHLWSAFCTFYSYVSKMTIDQEKYDGDDSKYDENAI